MDGEKYIMFRDIRDCLEWLEEGGVLLVGDFYGVLDSMIVYCFDFDIIRWLIRYLIRYWLILLL